VRPRDHQLPPARLHRTSGSVGVQPRERAPRDAVELERRTWRRRELPPERRVRIRPPVGLGTRGDVIELASVEGSGSSRASPRRYASSRSSAGVRVAAPCPAPVDDERDEMTRHDGRAAHTSAERNVTCPCSPRMRTRADSWFTLSTTASTRTGSRGVRASGSAPPRAARSRITWRRAVVYDSRSCPGVRG